MEKILTISIAAYNAANDIPRCIDSLVASGTLDYLDVIIVNDGSKDNTEEVALKYVEQYKESIRLINKKNGGHGSTINTSIQYAIGKYYKILDSDDWVDSENLARLVEFLKNVDVDMVLNPYVEVAYEDHSKTKLFRPDLKNENYGKVLPLDELAKEVVLYMHSLTFNTQVIKKMGSIIDENCFYVDMEYCIFPLLYIHNFVSLEYPVYQYLLGSQLQSMNQKNLIKRREQHLKVTRRLICFYDTHFKDIDANLIELILLRIKYAVYQQYKIYLLMNSREAKQELMKFDSWLSEQNPAFYEGPKGRLMRLMKLIRKSRFRLYYPISLLVKFMGR